MSWTKVKWPVIASIVWSLLLLLLSCAGMIVVGSQSLPVAETQARSRMIGEGVGKLLVGGWATIWVVWFLAGRKGRS